MKQRCLSIFLSITLMASVIAGAISVSFSFVKADAPGSYDPLVWSDFWELAVDHAKTSSDLQILNSISNDVISYKDNSLFNIVVINYGTKYAAFGFVIPNDAAGFLIRSWSNGSIQGGGVYQNYNNQYVRALFYICFDDNSTGYIQLLSMNTQVTIGRRSEAFGFSVNQYSVCWPTKFEQQGSGYKVYNLRSINPWDTVNAAASPANILWERPVQSFTLCDFWLGERHYLSITDQFWLSRMDPEKMGYGWGLFTAGILNEAYDYGDVISIPGATNFIDIQFTNTPLDGSIYAVDITDWNLNEITDIDYSAIYEIVDNQLVTVAEAINVPLNIERPGGESNPSTEIWNEWNTYITNYPDYNIVPQQLVPQFYGKQAAACKPCEVAPPSSLWNAKHDVITFGQDIFEYHFPLVSSPAYNYELFDVCVLSQQGLVTGEILGWDYSLMWWYSDSSSPQSRKIQDVNFDMLLEMFDIIIVVDDPDRVLMDFADDLVYTGDYEYGFTYSEDAFTHGNVLYGFAFVTEKAVQKQLLFNFNDGITKTYDLMSQYISKRDAWDNSFLDWTTTLYTEFQTLWGSLDDIYKLLFSWSGLLESIDEKLGQIAENTSEEDPGYWFISFYNWIKRWEPSNSDFANWVDSWDDFTDDIPDPGSGVTVIPFPTLIPTTAVAGG